MTKSKNQSLKKEEPPKEKPPFKNNVENPPKPKEEDFQNLNKTIDYQGINNSLSIDESSLNATKISKAESKMKNSNEPHKMQKYEANEIILEEERNYDGDPNNLNKLLEGMAFLFKNQIKLEESQKRVEAKLDTLIDLVKNLKK